MSPAELLCQRPLVLYRNFLHSNNWLTVSNIKYNRSQQMTDADTTLSLCWLLGTCPAPLSNVVLNLTCSLTAYN